MRVPTKDQSREDLVLQNKEKDQKLFVNLKIMRQWTINLTEDIKNKDILYFVISMSSIKSQAEEVVFSKLLYL